MKFIYAFDPKTELTRDVILRNLNILDTTLGKIDINAVPKLPVNSSKKTGPLPDGIVHEEIKKVLLLLQTSSLLNYRGMNADGIRDTKLTEVDKVKSADNLKRI